MHGCHSGVPSSLQRLQAARAALVAPDGGVTKFLKARLRVEGFRVQGGFILLVWRAFP